MNLYQSQQCQNSYNNGAHPNQFMHSNSSANATSYINQNSGPIPQSCINYTTRNAYSNQLMHSNSSDNATSYNNINQNNQANSNALESENLRNREEIETLKNKNSIQN